tara:strand:- start:85 stop:408 length:324 start_codon:yes stop_codon:yes gene_type:complete
MSLSFSQTIGDVNIKDIDVEYMQIVGTKAFLTKKVSIALDYGQTAAGKVFGRGKMVVKDKDGKKVKFNSMIDALNFLSANGYDFIDAYAINVGNQNVYHYMMKKNNK